MLPSFRPTSAALPVIRTGSGGPEKNPRRRYPSGRLPPGEGMGKRGGNGPRPPGVQPPPGRPRPQEEVSNPPSAPPWVRLQRRGRYSPPGGGYFPKILNAAAAGAPGSVKEVQSPNNAFA